MSAGTPSPCHALSSPRPNQAQSADHIISTIRSLSFSRSVCDSSIAGSSRRGLRPQKLLRLGAAYARIGHFPIPVFFFFCYNMFIYNVYIYIYIIYEHMITYIAYIAYIYANNVIIIIVNSSGPNRDKISEFFSRFLHSLSSLVA